MGIGRREFLRLFSAGIAAVASPTAAIAIHDNQYINRRLGIAFEKPNGWVFSDVKQMAEVKVGQILDLDDSELSREILESAEHPILTISKDAISAESDRFTPGITVYLDRMNLDTSSQPDEFLPAPILERDAESCNLILKDFSIISGITPLSVSACKAAEYDASFLFEHENIYLVRFE